MTPEWIVEGLKLTASLGAGALILEYLKKRWNRNKESADLKKSYMDFNKVYTDAKYVEFQLTEQLQKMVDEKTENLQDILVKREVEHAAQVEHYVKKLAEEIQQKELFAKELSVALKEIDNLKRRVKELEDHNGLK